MTKKEGEAAHLIPLVIDYTLKEGNNKAKKLTDHLMGEGEEGTLQLDRSIKEETRSKEIMKPKCRLEKACLETKMTRNVKEKMENTTNG